jgi:transcriptional regulator with XRE-family HTH domain
MTVRDRKGMKKRNDKLEMLIKENGFTIAKLAKAVGKDRSTVNRWINQGRIPDKETQRKVARLLKTSPSAIWQSDSKEDSTFRNVMSFATQGSEIQWSDRKFSILMESVTNYVLIEYGADAQPYIPITLLIEEIAARIERNICVTVKVVNEDTIRNRTFADMQYRQKFLQELKNLQNKLTPDQRKLLDFRGVKAVDSLSDFVVLIDGGHVRLILHNGYWELTARGVVP